MTWSEFDKLVSKLGYPVRYGVFHKAQKPPFLLFGLEGRSDLMADDIHLVPITNGFLELYTTEPEPDIQKRIEEHLTENGITWSFDYQQEIEKERVWMTRWMFDFIGG